MKVWITRDALSKGKIYIVDGEIWLDNPNFFNPENLCGLFAKRHWHTTESAAIAKAEQMRLAKIASLRKQIAKLEQLKF